MVEPFEGVFGNSSELRILQFLLPLKGMEFNISELADEVGVTKPTITRVVAKLIKFGLMKKTRVAGHIKYYSINEDSPFISLVEELNNLLIEQMLDEETLYQIHDKLTITGKTEEVKPVATIKRDETDIPITSVWSPPKGDLYSLDECPKPQAPVLWTQAS